MTTKDKEIKQMLLALLYIHHNVPEYATERSGIIPVMDKVQTQVQKAIDAQTQQGIPTHGVTTTKGGKFHVLALSLFRLCSAASGYFASIPDEENRAKVAFTLDQIESHLYNGIESFTDGILLVITPAIAALLGPFGGSVVKRDDVVAKLLDWHNYKDKVGVVIGDRKTQTADIHPFVKEGKRIIVIEANPIINTLFEDFPDLYHNWYNSFNIHNFPHGTTVAEGFMLAPDGSGIYGGTVYFPEQNFNVPTMLDGSFLKTHFPHGITTPKATHPLYRTNVANPYEIKQGKTVSHIFHMIPN